MAQVQNPTQTTEDGKPIPQPDGVNSKDALTPEAEALQAAEDEVAKQGFRGVATDPTPDEHYSIAGQLAGKPTPETHPEQAVKAGSRKFEGNS